MAWTDERIAALKRLWEEGLSASQIAARLGGVTRNAVIGKVHRLGLSGRPSPLRPDMIRPAPAPRPAPQPAAVRAAPAPRPVAPPVMAPPPPPVPTPVEAVPVAREPGKRTTLLNITDRMCKWPVGHPGDPDFHFCGDKSVTGQPYCQAHAAIAYQHSGPKRDKRDRAGGVGY
jgi:GcrA cell cycle regulator